MIRTMVETRVMHDGVTKTHRCCRGTWEETRNDMLMIIASLQKEIDEGDRLCPARPVELATAPAQAAEQAGRTDSERLDWLIVTGLFVVRISPSKWSHGHEWVIMNGSGSTANLGDGCTPRAALDAAMDRSGGDGAS